MMERNTTSREIVEGLLAEDVMELHPAYQQQLNMILVPLRSVPVAHKQTISCGARESEYAHELRLTRIR